MNKTLEQIEFEINSIIPKFQLSEKVVHKISEDYFNLQKELLLLSNNYISISIGNKISLHDKTKPFLFNNIIQIDANDIDNLFAIIKYTTLIGNSGIHYTTGYNQAMTSIMPSSYENISISNGSGFIDLKSLQIYIFDNLVTLNNLYYDKINKCTNFLIPLNTIINFLREKSINLELIIPNDNKHHSTDDIIHNIEKNMSFFETLDLSYDFDFKKEFNLLNKYQKTEKNNMKKTSIF